MDVTEIYEYEYEYEYDGTYRGPVIEDVVVTADLVRLKLKQLKTSSAAGPDGLHPRVLHEIRDSVSSELASIYRETLDTGVLPED